MPSGRTHLKLELALLIPWVGVLSWGGWQGVLGWAQLGTFLGSYLFSMWLLSPDLDLTTSSALRRWGPLRWIWLPYAWIFRHRQISHSLLLGPPTRILYLVLWVVLISIVLLKALGEPLPRVRMSSELLGAAIVGMFAPNVIHILADRACTAWRRRRRKRRL